MTREFDLNIERVLENWTVAHALREVIANALDEQALTGTAEPQIFRDAHDIEGLGEGLVKVRIGAPGCPGHVPLDRPYWPLVAEPGAVNTT